MAAQLLKQKVVGKKPQPLKFVGGSRYMKELQKTVFFAAYDMAVFSSARSMTEKEQKEEILRQSILGSGDATMITLPEQMVLGINQFASLYDEVDPEQVDDRNAVVSVTDSANPLAASSIGGFSTRNDCDKILKECYFPQKPSGGKLAIFANKADGITKELLVAKNLSNPVDVSVGTILRGAKEVTRNGRKALECAKAADSEYKDGKLPSGKAQCM
jgi:hypothetical protein